MAAGDLNIALILKLVDQATGPARAVTNSLRQIGAVTEQTGRAGVAWANEQLAANQARRSALMGEAFGVAALAGSLAASLRPAINFERSMAEVAAVARADDEELARLTETARELGATTPWAASEAAQGMKFLAMAGFEASETIDAMPGMLQLASAGAIDLARASDIASNILTGFGMQAGEMGYLGDVLTNTFTSSNTDLGMLGETMKYVAPNAQALGVSLEQTAAMAGKLGDAGIQGSQAGTALRAMMLRLAALPKPAADAMAELGVQTVDASGNLRDMPTILAEVHEALQKLGTGEQAKLINDIFGMEAASAAAVLLEQAGSGALQAYAETLTETGSAARIAARMNDTAAGAIKRLQSMAESLAISVGSILLPQIVELLDTIIPVIESVRMWAEAHPELISMIFKLTAGLLFFRLGSIALRWVLFSMLTPILQIIRAASWLLVLLPRLGRALLALLNPMKLVRGALIAIRLAFLATGIGAFLAGIAMAGIWIYNNWEGLKTFFVGFWRTFREALGPAAPMLDSIIDYARQIWEWFTNLLGPMEATEEQWLSWGQNAGEALGQVVGNVARWMEENKGLIGTIAKLYAWFFALRLIWRFPMAPIRTAGSVLAWLWRGPVMWLFGGLRQLGRAFFWLGRMAPLLMRGAGMAIAWVATGPIKWLLSGVGLIAKAFIRLGLLMLTNPIGLIIAGVAILAKVVYDNWDKIVSFFIEKVDAVKAAFDEGLLNGVFKLLAEFNPFTLAVEGMQGLVAYVMELLGVPEEIVEAFREFDLFETGAELLKGLWDGMASLVPQMVAAISEKLSGIVPDWMQDAWNWVTGAEDAHEVSVPALSETAEFAALPEEQQDAVRTIESIGPVLPTEGYQLELQLREDELRRQIADLQASMTPPPEAFAYVQELQNAQADLAFAQELISEARAAGDQTELSTLEDEARALEALIANRQAMIASLTENGTQGQELARLETELAAVIERQAQAKAEAEALTQALMVINETDVRPDIDTASIDEALVKARRLSALLQNSSGVAAASAANPDGARDRGGPVRAGMPYLVGERSPEIFVPGVSGTILPGRVLKAAMAASAMAAPVAAMPSQAEIVETLDRRPVMSAPVAAPQITRHGDTISINIYPTQGMSVEDIGREVERRLARREDARRADLHDGVDY